MYEIIIRKKTTKTTIKMGEHTLIERRPWSKAKLESAAGYQTPEQFLEKNPTEPVYGYAPPIEKTEEVEVEMLKQCVDDLDLAAVIKAINKL